MQKKINWVQWLVLPLMMTACMGRESNQAATSSDDQQNYSSSGTQNAHFKPLSKQEENKNQSPQEGQSTSDHHSEVEDHSDHTHSDHHSEAGDHSDHTHSDHHSEAEDHSDHAHPDSHAEKDNHSELENAAVIPKTKVTPELEAQVKVAKEVRDNVGLPPGYRAIYKINADGKQKTVTVEVPQDRDIDENPFYPNASEIFPQGMSSGTITTSIFEDEKVQPHTEGRFMSYQQFYSGISGTHQDVVYFDGDPEQQEIAFFFDLPDGLLTTNEQLPVGGEATYQGKAIDGERFGDFRYEVNFARKEGKGKITWQDTQAGQLGNITLQTGKISEQLLSVHSEPEDFPPQYSQRGPGVQGIAKIEGSTGKEYQYQAVFFGPKAEELSGIVYELKHHELEAYNHEHEHSHDREPTIHYEGDSHHHEEEKINVAAFAGAR